MPGTNVPYSGQKTSVKSFFRLFTMLKPMIVSIIFVIFFVIVATVFQILGPVLVQDITSQEGFSQLFTIDALGNLKVNINAILIAFGIVVLVYLIYSIFSFIVEYMVSKISGVLTYKLRQDIKDKLDHLPLSFFDKNSNGDIISRVSNDIDLISSALHQILTQIIKSIALLIGTIIAMFTISWQCALIASAVLPLSILVAAVIGKASQPKFFAQQSLLGKVNSQIEESYAGLKVIKLFNKEISKQAEFNYTSRQLSKAGYQAFALSSMIMPFMVFINNLAYVGICVVAGFLGNASTIIVFFLFLQLFQQPIQQIAQLSSNIQQTAAASERVYSILDTPNQVADGQDSIDAPSDLKGLVEFKDVSFSYEPSSPLIEDLNLLVQPGDSIAIVGPTGAGKTTLVNLIMRFYEVDKGNITIDGVDVTDYKRSSIRQEIGMVLQDTWLFNGTIAENIAYGDISASREEIIQAAKEAHAHHFITTLPQGYDTILNEEGSNVSQGQRQLLTIARAILSKPRILILDEATSSVDTRTEKALQDAMTSMMKNRTTFVIAHRLSTIKSAKTILVMNKGHIIESGSHFELLTKGGFYADLYNAQFLGNKEKTDESETNS